MIVMMIHIPTFLQVFTDTIPEFHKHPDHVDEIPEAIPGPSDEKDLDSIHYKKDMSIEPVQATYDEIRRRLLYKEISTYLVCL